MVLLNNQHINRPAGRDSNGLPMFGGAMCTCGQCRANRKESQKQDAADTGSAPTVDPKYLPYIPGIQMNPSTSVQFDDSFFRNRFETLS